jgi:N-acetylneuraminic acid mutarotase
MQQVSAPESARLTTLAALVLIALSGCSDQRTLPTSPPDETPSFLVAAGSGSWATKAPMPTARNTLTAAAVNGVLYAVGGKTGNTCSGLKTVEAYDPTADAWTTKAPMPTGRFNPSAVNIGGLLYVVGGDVGCGTRSAALEAYDPATNSWTTRTPMPTARTSAVAAVANGVLYVIGGVSGNNLVATVEAYDPTTDAWTTKTSIPTATCCAVAGTINGIVYVAALGGSAGTANMVEAYDPATDTWAPKAPVPTLHSTPAGGAVNGILYVVGGQDATTGALLTTVDAYDPATDTWTSVAQTPTARIYHAVGVANGVLYAVGGGDDPAVVGTNQAFTPAYSFTGFFSPVDNPDVVNLAKAGSAIPVKFSLGSDLGLNILKSGSPTSAPYACGSGPTDAIEQTVAATNSGLQYDATANQYTYVWKTDKSWSGTCRKFNLGLTDGSTHVALFQFK